ncbi:MAG: hypothetical protein HFF52_03975 [Lawsonibacter sp.]|nr:hypothetical protein [Lawsonibacter sp.]
MNKKLFDSMNEQLSPAPEVRAALNEKLAQPAKKRPGLWKKYGALAACAVLAVGVLGVSRYPGWEHILQNYRPSVLKTELHSYVTVDGPGGYVQENTTTTETGGGDTGAPNTGGLPNRDHAPSGALPGGTYAGDAPSQGEAVNAYEKLMDHFNGQYPDWYGGAYIDNTGTLIVQLVEREDPADKSLELQVIDWTGNGRVGFSSCKYSLAHLSSLMDELNALPRKDMKCSDVMAGWGIDEVANRIELTLTQVYDPILSILAELDPDDDAICVQVGQRASRGGDVPTNSAKTEDPVSHDVMPGGATVPDVPEGKDPIAYEPWYDGAHYGAEDLPQTPPEQNQPAFTVDSASRDSISAAP